jgi:CBS domain-containing protein
MGTNVRDVMTARPRSAAPDTPLSQVAELMEAEDVGARFPSSTGTSSRE